MNDDHPSHGEQELEDQLTQEQFDNKLENGLEVMLTQEELVEDEDLVGEPREEKAERMPKVKKGMMMRMMIAHQGDM
jgi:hypothetical protein